MPTVGAALLVGLLPVQAFAVPPDPAAAERGREDTLKLETLDPEVPIEGVTEDRNLETLRATVPPNRVQPPPNTTTTPVGTGSVDFGSATTATTAAVRSGATAQQVADPKPVGTLPVSLGQAPDQAAPKGIWDVRVYGRTESVAQGVDGTVVGVQAPATGSVPISVRVNYAKFKSLYGADWASRLTFVQFPECYLDTPQIEACQEYVELETTNDTAAQAVTAIVDTAADGTVTPASARPEPISGGPSIAQVSYRSSSTATGTAVAASGDRAAVGVVDSGQGNGGSFKATPLASSGKWAAGGSSGAFTWSYPLTVPAAPAGPAPSISLGYNSQTVDGRTAVSSPQVSWIGEGWDYDPGHIERRYRSCQDDRKTLKSGIPNNKAAKDKTSDLCWVSYNAVMSLAGRTTELVRDAPAGSNPETDTEVYRPMQDDGTRVERRVAGTNRDDNGEYWIVTTTDGTKYYYGLNKVGGGHADTDSVSTVPVFGNHPGEPCNSTVFANSRCGAGKQQAWRWGLDKVVDVHGNTLVISWNQEKNHYAVKKKFTAPEQYDRFAYPRIIEYGMRADLTKPSATVEFGAEQRCLESAAACDDDNFAKTDDPGAYRLWWDTPGNLNCKATSKMCPAFPSFWTQMRLATITTKGARPGQTGLGKVDTYTLNQSFPKDWYDTAPSLWLNSITRRGFAPGDSTGILQHTDGVSFSEYKVGSTSPLRVRLRDKQLPNLVRTGPGDQRPGFTRPRIGTVSTESGGDVEVEYQGGCAIEPATDKGRDNGTCYPVRWSPDGDEKTPAKAWFNKYVVASVTERDKVTSHGQDIHTLYEYTGPAWSKSDDEFTRPSLRTFSDWRGYREVAVTKGSSTVGNGILQTQSYSKTRYFLGVGGQVKDSEDKYTLLADDDRQYAGMTAETITYRDSGKKVQQRTLNFPWSKQTASRPREAEDATDMEPLLAHRSGVRRTDEIQTVDTSWRAVRTLTAVDDSYGLPIQVETAVVKPNGSAETLSDQTCTVTTYVHNPAAWLIGLPKSQRSTGTSCAGLGTADPETKLIKSVSYSYDGSTSGIEIPSKGQVTTVTDVDGTGTSDVVAARATYDPLGRIRTVTKPGAGTTRTEYTPGDGGGPVTAVTTTNALGHAVTTTFDPGRSLALTVTDANNRVTRSEYDALGRMVRGWSPSRSAGGKPDVVISYDSAIANGKVTRPAAVTTSTLKDDGTYSRQVTLYDGLLRQVQTQSEAHGPGRVISDTTYDDHGLVDEQKGAYLAKGDPATALFSPRSETLIPSKVKFRYDGLERPYRESTYHAGEFKYETDTTYSDTSTYVDPPGSTAPRTRTFTDALGRVTSILHYKDAAATDQGRTTTYTYDARGYRTEVKDPAGNVWSYKYDARGRVVSTTDPDVGRTDTWFDDADRPNKVTDAENRTTFTEYDELGRVRYVREGSATGAAVKSFTYDMAGALGLPVASTRHSSQGDYTNRVTGYDTEYRPTGTETTIASNPLTAGLSGTYAYKYTYTPTGNPLSVTLPAIGGLPQEKVVTRYNSDGLPESTSGLTWYTADVTYSPYGEPLRTVSGAQPYRVWTTNFIDPSTGRLQRTVADRETADPHRITDSYYSYDESGMITSNSRQLTDGSTTPPWDTQCFTYDVMGELANAWTSNITPVDGKSCKAANGTTWGHRQDYGPSSGPVADAPDTASDATAPDDSLKSTLLATTPDATTVSTGATAYRQSFTFDWLGNRAAMTEYNPADATKNVTLKYGYGNAQGKQPHTLGSITSSPAGQGSGYQYDAVGNTKVRDLSATTQNLTWTQENKPATITDDGKTTTYIYDANGNRLLEKSPSGSTLYLGETEVTTDASGTIVRASRSYAHPGAPTVVRTTSNGATTGHKRNVMLSDHLGTSNTTIEVTNTTQPVTRRAFKPYGEVRGPKPASWPNKRGYLGVGIGLTHMGAREYDQGSGRFLSADPIIDIADPLQMNGYAYSGNSPISKSDPTGLRPAVDCGTRPDPNSENTTPGHAPVKKKSSQNYSAAVDDGNVAPPAFKKKYQEVYPGVYVDRSWEYADRYEQQLWKDAANWCQEDGASCLATSEDEQVGQNILTHIKFLACMHLGRESGCLGKIPALGAVAMIAMTGVGERPGGLGVGGNRSSQSSGPCSQCFLAGTDVLLADKSSKDIEDIRVGDEVLATDPETGETGPRKVTRLIITEDDKRFNELSIATEDGIEKLTATNEHPFWVPELGHWVATRNLAVGMHLRKPDGSTVTVAANRPFSKRARTYNLTVDDLHTYYVLAGGTPVLVHNSNCGGRWKLGEDYSKPNKNGVAPSLSTMRKRFWKNEAMEPDAADQYGAANISRMKRGSAPQRQRPDGSWESMELSHEPIPERDGGMLLTPRWPEDHAIMDPGGYRRLPPGY
ncbi:polymorphic toxin-type HINT domain-containing protein [Streptomyces graminilatus]|uniref:polymorphic toxin-type HINT domain-containing protein n=1 Tax=Streptomyces graminilatus TaxID=1464070 RepID=UPI000A8EC7FF|nr:polymorphic toxin-type HINT domain-containing protein [Streptomyces graminilatus]